MTRGECLLTSRQVAKVVGLKYATLDRWLRPERGGFLHCEQEAAGRASTRLFSFLDVLRVDAVARMRRNGVPLGTIRRVLAELEEYYQVADPLLGGGLVIAGDKLFWELDRDTLLDVLAQQLAMAPLVVLPLGDMIRENRAKVEALCTETGQQGEQAIAV
jgi:DNA-binding transcriptional MerR regulator